MPSKKLDVSSKTSLPFKTANRERRQSLHIKRKKAQDSLKREERFRRKKEERRDPELKEQRLRQNVPLTLERKRVWDDVDNDTGDGLGLSIDVERVKRQKVDEGEDGAQALDKDIHSEDDKDSMIDSESEDDDIGDKPPTRPQAKSATARATSPTRSTTSTSLDLTPEALAARFPTLFSMEESTPPKILITTSLNSSLHHEAEILTNVFTNSTYIPRSAHRYSHKFSVKEIATFASKRGYTAVIVVKEDQKKPTALTFVHLPGGPTFHFSISNWIEGKKIPGHGNPTGHAPELILNNFRTPLGLLTAHLFRTMFPSQPGTYSRNVATFIIANRAVSHAFGWTSAPKICVKEDY